MATGIASLRNEVEDLSHVDSPQLQVLILA